MGYTENLGYGVFVFALFLLLSACSQNDSDADVSGWAPIYTISGTIYAQAGTRLDSDVNDTSGPAPRTNNDFASAQGLDGLPVTVGGYLNQPGQGAEGQSYAQGDDRDIYQVDNLTGNEVFRLVLPDESEAQVRLILYDQDDPDQELASRLPAPRTAVVLPPGPGSYFVEVRITAGATAYRLMVGEPLAAAQTMALGPGADFIPGEVIVKLKDLAADTASSNAAAAGIDTQRGLGARRGLTAVHSETGPWIRLRVTDYDAARHSLGLNDLPGYQSRAGAHLGTVGGGSADLGRQDTLEIIHALARLSEVAYAEPNYIRRASFVPDDPLYPFQWHHDLINLPRAWDLTQGSADVRVAILDTGVLFDHPDLVDKLSPGFDFISDADSAADGDGVDSDPTDEGDIALGGSIFHGTHVAGIIAAAMNNHTGVAGSGGHTTVMPVRVLGREDGTSFDIIQGLLWAAGLATSYDATEVPPPAAPAHIINCSFAGYGFSQAEQDVVDQVRQAGVIIVAAAGNEATNDLVYPAAYEGVISVSAVGADGLPAPYTNFGAAIDIAAPGGDVYSDAQPDGYVDGILSTMAMGANTLPQMTYGYLQGTSMSAPQVAAVAALMKAVRPGLTAGEFSAYVTSGQLSGRTADGTSADDAKNQFAGRAAGFEHDGFYGFGLLDAYQAVLAAHSDPPATLSVSPRSVYIAHGEHSAVLFARQVGALSQTSTTPEVSANVPWLRVTYSDNRSDGSGGYDVSVIRSSLSGGFHTATVLFSASSNTVAIPVQVEVLPDARANAGMLYLSLIAEQDLGSGIAAQQIALAPRNGRYTFSFTEVSPGTYYLICGSDLNNDSQLTDLGEAVGGYPSLALWYPVEVQGHVQGLEFVAGTSQWAFANPARALAVADGH